MNENKININVEGDDDEKKDQDHEITPNEYNTWPKEIANVFVISIRDERFKNIKNRLHGWSGMNILKFSGTDGRHIDKSKYVTSGKLNKYKCFSRGQIGCYHSHVRLWERVAKGQPQKLPTLIMEDDAIFPCNHKNMKIINDIVTYLRTNDVTWHVIFCGHYGDSAVRNKHMKACVGGTRYGPYLWSCDRYQGLFNYLINPAGAKILLKNAWPMKHAADIYVGEMMKTKNIVALRVEPSFGFVVNVISDTQRIK